MPDIENRNDRIKTISLVVLMSELLGSVNHCAACSNLRHSTFFVSTVLEILSTKTVAVLRTPPLIFHVPTVILQLHSGIGQSRCRHILFCPALPPVFEVYTESGIHPLKFGGSKAVALAASKSYWISCCSFSACNCFFFS